MRLKFSGIAERELAAIPLRDRKTLGVAIRLLKADPYPETAFYLAMFRAIIADYYNNEGWKYDLH